METILTPVAEAVAASGARLVSARLLRRHPTHVQHRVRLVRGGRQREETFVYDGQRAWPWHLDPALPGLQRALRWPEATSTAARSYRPGRRAVVEATTTTGRVFLKVVRPDKAAALVASHDAARSGTPAVARVLDATDDGVVVLEARPGTPYRQAARRPPPAALHALLDRLPPVDRPPVDAFDAASHHARSIAAVLPEARPLLDDILGALEWSADARDVVTIHGDFHPGQLLVADGEVTGLLDVDGLRQGRRDEDVATLTAHLLVAPIGDEGERWDTVGIAALVAANLVALATGPYRRVERDWEARTLAILNRARRATSRPRRGVARVARSSPR